MYKGKYFIYERDQLKEFIMKSRHRLLIHGVEEVLQGEVLHIKGGQLGEFMSKRDERLVAVSME